MTTIHIKRFVLLAFLIFLLGFAGFDAWLLRKPFARQFTPVAEQLAADRQTYLTAEGPEHRGPKFSVFVQTLDRSRRDGKTYTQQDVLDELGQPDYRVKFPQLEQWFYVFDNFEKKDYFCQVNFDPAGHVREFTFDLFDSRAKEYLQANAAGTQPSPTMP